MESTMQQLDYGDLSTLKEQRQTLRRQFQAVKAMTGVKKAIQEAQEEGVSF